MTKIVTIVGARPQFVKAAAVSRAMKEPMQQVLVHTGQHFDRNMSDIFFEEMKIPKPDYQLGIGGGSHGAMTGKMLEKIEEVLLKEKPDWALVFGDTNSTLAGALAASKLHIPVAHVEAGLRSFNRKMPEEINRVLADQCSDLLFTPTKGASEQLVREGIPEEKIRLVGDVMHDAAKFYRAGIAGRMLPEGLKSKEYVLATIHRQENTDRPELLKAIFEGLIEVAKEIAVVIPLHPGTRKALEKAGLMDEAEERLQIVDPVGYLDMILLESEAQAILTDSGGVQKEAYFFHVPCLTLRSETEWVELVEEGFNMLAPLTKEGIAEAYHILSEKTIDWSKELYGSGNSGELILKALQS